MGRICKYLTEEEKKTAIKLASKKYSEKNKGKIKEYRKIYREKNKEKISDQAKEYNKKWSKNNLEYQKNYREINHENIKLKRNKREKERKSEDLIYNLKTTISRSFRQSFKRNGYTKNSRTHDILGCSFEELKVHLENKFESWMNWDNRGLYNGELNYGWDIDHIIPLSTAKTEEDIKKLNHYTNLQPLCGYINRYIKKCIDTKY